MKFIEYNQLFEFNYKKYSKVKQAGKKSTLSYVLAFFINHKSFDDLPFVIFWDQMWTMTCILPISYIKSNITQSSSKIQLICNSF